MLMDVVISKLGIMKNIPFLPVLLVFYAQAVSAQNPNPDYKVGIKLYNHSTYHITSENRTPGYRTETRNYDLLRLSPAVQWKTGKGNFHEIELSDFRLNNKESVSTATSWQNPGGMSILSSSFISARYEYILNARKMAESKWVPSFGFAVNPYFQRQYISPLASNQFATTDNSLGVRFFVVPRISYHFNNRLFADLNIPVCISDNRLSTLYQEDLTYR